MHYPRTVRYVRSSEPNEVHMATRELGDPESDEVIIKSEFSAGKLGTELAVLSGRASTYGKRYDHAQRLMVRKENPAYLAWPGNMTVGSIVATGSAVKDFHVGERVFAHGGFQEYHRRATGDLYHLGEGLTPEAALCLDPADVALGAVRDSHIRMGDGAVIFGLGAIGLFAAQMARLQGAGKVIVVDPMEHRRKLACAHGADAALNPLDVDVGLAVRDILGRPGADVCIESSGNYRALQAAIRSVAYGGTVCVVSFYLGEAKGLFLGEEWHFNQVRMISSRTDSLPPRDHPRWDRRRFHDTALALLAGGKLNVTGLIDPVVPFEQTPEAYMALMRDPGKGIKLGVTY